ncbi:ABC transporter ATP-binding protein [Roseiconus lacunae]|uniref:ABC transporter ATP-binding protein n=1 Tax=Roseiconus lacunae TaxID=2605694 RepID=UPI0011F0A581|nr:ABC transporter ATP-binding protein [Roseiconus lacunae]MCD0459182.1 ABC transporter ATP-binding protein [Roseiconus lacunae]WRQ51798.1 ABC transporter ATP-binding protein [Stieleria sp. HD01]
MDKVDSSLSPQEHSQANEAICKVEAASKSYPQGDASVEALRSVGLSIKTGAFVAVMGASGSGKSTLLHLIAGLTSPTGGSVVVDGVDLSTLSDAALTRFRRERIGLIFQSFNLVPALNASDNILLPLMAGGMKDDRSANVKELASRLGIDHRLEHRPDSLSGGEQQRVAIARALITEPAVLLADEPTGSLDSTTGQSICKLLRDLCDQQGRTIILVTHEPSVAVWADQVVVLKDGQIIEEFPACEFQDAQSLAAHYQEILDEGLPSPQAVASTS